MAIDRLRIYTGIDGKTIYKISFTGLSDLQKYLISEAYINKSVFGIDKELASVNKGYGDISYERSLECLISGYDKGYQEYLDIKTQIEYNENYRQETRKTIKSVAGSRPNVPNFIAGSPKNMYRLERQTDYKIIKINFALSYNWRTTQEQVYNRGILTMNLIRLLENNGYRVILNTFELAQKGNEIIYIAINLKNPNEFINEKKCFFPICRQEFLRRDLFRVLECMPVRENWSFGYGQTLDKVDSKRVLGIKDNEIIISEPHEMGIIGYDINEDYSVFSEEIGLDRFIDYKKLIKR